MSIESKQNLKGSIGSSRSVNGKTNVGTAVGIPGNNGAPSDWNQNNPAVPGYVKNRPFWTDDPVETVVAAEQVITLNGDWETTTIVTTNVVTDSDYYRVTVDGVEHKCENLGRGIDGYAITEFFEFWLEEGGFVVAGESAGQYTVSIIGAKETVHQIESKYIPNYNFLCFDLYEYIQSAGDWRLQTTLKDGSMVYAIDPSVDWFIVPRLGLYVGSGVGIYTLNSVGDNYFSIAFTDIHPNKVAIKYFVFVHSDNVEQGIADYKADYGIE